MNGEYEPLDIVSQAFCMAAAVEQFVTRARTFYYEVMLSAHECPECKGSLEMVTPGRCRCLACEQVFDPTMAFQQCEACGGRPELKIRRYQCGRCGHDVASRFLFDGLVFDAEYFRQKMAESRERKRELRERVRQMLAESRSPVIQAEPMDLAAMPGLLEALDGLVQAETGGLDAPLMPAFSLNRYVPARVQVTAAHFNNLPRPTSSQKLYLNHRPDLRGGIRTYRVHPILGNRPDRRTISSAMVFTPAFRQALHSPETMDNRRRHKLVFNAPPKEPLDPPHVLIDVRSAPALGDHRGPYRLEAKRAELGSLCGPEELGQRSKGEPNPRLLVRGPTILDVVTSGELPVGHNQFVDREIGRATAGLRQSSAVDQPQSEQAIILCPALGRAVLSEVVVLSIQGEDGLTRWLVKSVRWMLPNKCGHVLAPSIIAKTVYTVLGRTSEPHCPT